MPQRAAFSMSPNRSSQQHDSWHFGAKQVTVVAFNLYGRAYLPEPEPELLGVIDGEG
jgi:hypothetical protein